MAPSDGSRAEWNDRHGVRSTSPTCAMVLKLVRAPTKLPARSPSSRHRGRSSEALSRSGPAPLKDMRLVMNLSMREFDLAELEADTLKVIDRRELRLATLYTLLLHGYQMPPDAVASVQAAKLGSLRTQLADELRELRLLSTAVVECIVRWRRRSHRKLEPFVWRSHNYLLKMLLDVHFLGLSDSVADACQDPFLLACFLPMERSPQGGGAAVRPSTSTLTGGAPRAPCGTASLVSFFAPGRRHTKHELVRMWAAERILETERAGIGESFVPVAPAMQPSDIELRRNAGLLFFGHGEPAALTLFSQPRVVHSTSASLDPAQKPLPPRRRKGTSSQRLAPMAGNAVSRRLKRDLGPQVSSRVLAVSMHKLPGVSPPPFVPLADPLERPRTVACGTTRKPCSSSEQSSSLPRLARSCHAASSDTLGFFAPSAPGSVGLEAEVHVAITSSDNGCEKRIAARAVEQPTGESSSVALTMPRSAGAAAIGSVSGRCTIATSAASASEMRGTPPAP